MREGKKAWCIETSGGGYFLGIHPVTIVKEDSSGLVEFESEYGSIRCTGSHRVFDTFGAAAREAERLSLNEARDHGRIAKAWRRVVRTDISREIRGDPEPTEGVEVDY